MLTCSSPPELEVMQDCHWLSNGRIYQFIWVIRTASHQILRVLRFSAGFLCLPGFMRMR